MNVRISGHNISTEVNLQKEKKEDMEMARKTIAFQDLKNKSHVENDEWAELLKKGRCSVMVPLNGPLVPAHTSLCGSKILPCSKVTGEII